MNRIRQFGAAHQVLDSNLLDRMRLVGDPMADNYISGIFADEVQKLAMREWLARLSLNRQLKVTDINMQFGTACQLPDWAHVKMMKQGSDFFARHAKEIMGMLGLLSLPYCYAAADGAMVLYLSDRIRNDTQKRLSDTAAFVWDVLSPDAFKPEGQGFAAILKVRLMHAAARFYTLKSGKWNDAWGYPINQEDMAGTNLSFSLIVIRGLRKMGIAISAEDQQAYLHLWNVIGSLLGLQPHLIPWDGKAAYQLESLISKRHFRYSEQGSILAASLIAFFKKNNTAQQLNNVELVQLMRYLLGNEVADILQLPIGELPALKINLINIKSYFNIFKIQQRPELAYQTAYAAFNHQQIPLPN